ncbi:hypothetical protein [Mannheimia indoligenes]|uniref:hypothetical protein n=1 Tax=Mannheimia indoligenes TaxID=3103145 RepID=UPI002FE595F2
MNNTTAQTTQRNWQEIIANLQEINETGQGTIEMARLYEDVFKTAEQLQALMNNNGTEAEKEAFFAPIEGFYIRFLQTKKRPKIERATGKNKG